MSLILDALKKLEREKEKGEPSLLVVGAVPWEGVGQRRRPILALGLAALVLLLAIALGASWLRQPHAVRPEAAAAAPVATPARAAASLTPAHAPASSPGDPTASSTPQPKAPPVRRLELPQPAMPSTLAVASAPAAPDPAPPSRPGPQLNAISQQDGRPVAVIDGRIVREGDSIDGIRVLRIGETEVEVEIHGRRRTLRF